MLAIWVSIKLKKGLSFGHYLGLSGFDQSALLRYLPLYLILITGTIILKELFEIQNPEFMANIWETAGFMPLFIFGIVVAVPILEEILFRGFLYKGIKHSWAGPWGAVIVSSTVWTAIHVQYDLISLVEVFLLGLFLGWVRLKSRSIYPCILLHCLHNTIAMLGCWLTY